jgi:hypothetical protein
MEELIRWVNDQVESVEVYAKLNYLRDKAFNLLDEPWDEIKKEYMNEAENYGDIVLTVEEIDAIIKRMK